MDKIVEVKHLKKIYGQTNAEQTYALKDISFAVEKGEFIGIMGASGSGKSTLLNILSTIDTPTEGAIRIRNQDITKLKGNQLADFRGKEIGFIFQDFNLLEHMTAAENIAVPLSLQRGNPKEIDRKVQKIAEKLAIISILNQYPAEISGGQKQRVAAARALISEPVILLGDEPTGALDSKSAKSLLEMMDSLNKQEQLSILLVTHDPVSASYCHRILFIKDGEVYQEVKRNYRDRKVFYQEILDILGNLEKGDD